MLLPKRVVRKKRIAVYRDEIFRFNQFSIDSEEDIFERILKQREHEIDSKRFYLEFLSSEMESYYDFNNLESLKNLEMIVVV